MRARAKFIVSVGEMVTVMTMTTTTTMMMMMMTRVGVFGGSEDGDEDADEHA